MRILSSPINLVNRSIGSRRSSLLVAGTAIVVALLLAIPVFIARRSSAHGVNSANKKQQGCCAGQPAILRRMVGTYYTTENGFKSTLVLNNKGPNQIVATPILHSQNGQTFTASPVAVGGESSQEVDLNLLASIAGQQFRSGSFEFTYEGRILEMGGGLKIVDAGKSLIFDEQMLEPGMKFPSSRLEAVYAVPFEDSRVSVIFTNTTAQPVNVDGDAIFAGANGRHPVKGNLGPFETKIVSLPHGLVKKAQAGAVSLTHNGAAGALLAMIHLQDADRGYSESVNFTNPGGKTAERHGAGLRLGNVNNDPLKPVIAVRNIGDSATTVTAAVPYSKQNGSTGTIALPQVLLAPGEIKLLNTSNPQLKQNDFAAAGLEIKYTGAPGSVIASATSVSQSGNHVFALPMKDPQGGMSSTGGYPWFINGSSSTVVFIKNASDKEQTFRLDLIYQHGIWGSNLRKLAPHETYAFDIRQIRDAQVKGSRDDTLPLDVTKGHVYWTIFGSTEKALIGRAQTVDPVGGMASTYECQTCSCSAETSGFTTGYYSGKVEPIGEDYAEPGGTRNYRAMQQDYNCYGGGGSWFDVSTSVQWSTGNPSIATINSFGTVTAQNQPGTTSVMATWTAYNYQWNPNNEYCDTFSRTGDGISSFTTQCSVPTGETFTSTGWGDAFGIPTAAVWMQTLTPTATNFTGRTVYETDASIGTDGCHFTGSAFDPQTTCCDPNNPDTWLVASGNKWGPDLVGWLPEGVNYYREARLTRGLLLPCQFTYQQRMFINCGTLGIYSPYVTTTLVGVIDVTTVSSGRNINLVTKEWP
ncbi:MAG: hypothetical protein JMDDDDMK_02454 [Acidobacteria bacterium]|nr:hypothetical protein [Acidobacteriota bacterium]